MILSHCTGAVTWHEVVLARGHVGACMARAHGACACRAHAVHLLGENLLDDIRVGVRLGIDVRDDWDARLDDRRLVW